MSGLETFAEMMLMSAIVVRILAAEIFAVGSMAMLFRMAGTRG